MWTGPKPLIAVYSLKYCATDNPKKIEKPRTNFVLKLLRLQNWRKLRPPTPTNDEWKWIVCFELSKEIWAFSHLASQFKNQTYQRKQRTSSIVQQKWVVELMQRLLQICLYNKIQIFREGKWFMKVDQIIYLSHTNCWNGHTSTTYQELKRKSWIQQIFAQLFDYQHESKPADQHFHCSKGKQMGSIKKLCSLF